MDSYKLKLYDEGAVLSLDRTIQILTPKEGTKHELQESKTAEIESITKQEIAPYGRNGTYKGNEQDSKKVPFQSRGKNWKYCNCHHPPGRRNCPAATRCIKCNKIGHFPEICRSTPVNLVSQVSETEGDICPTFVGGVTTPNSTSLPLTPTIEPASIHQTSTSDSGWYVKLKVQDQELTWCIDTGAQVSVMPESLYKESYEPLSQADRELVGAGDVPLRTLGFAPMTLALHKTRIQERVYIVKGHPNCFSLYPQSAALALFMKYQEPTESIQSSIRGLLIFHLDWT